MAKSLVMICQFPVFIKDEYLGQPIEAAIRHYIPEKPVSIPVHFKRELFFPGNFGNLAEALRKVNRDSQHTEVGLFLPFGVVGGIGGKLAVTWFAGSQPKGNYRRFFLFLGNGQYILGVRLRGTVHIEQRNVVRVNGIERVIINPDMIRSFLCKQRACKQSKSGKKQAIFHDKC